MGVSIGMSCWAICVKIVILLINLFFFYDSHFLRHLLIFKLASMPNHCTRYHWGGTSELSVKVGLF